MARERATELEYLKWFRKNADFGPAHGDEVDRLNAEFMEETGKNLPEGWNYDQEGEVNDRNDPEPAISPAPDEPKEGGDADAAD